MIDLSTWTIDTLIMIYIAGLFTLIVVCLYALIQSKANKVYTFIIIPMALLMASMTWQGIKLLQGMPVYGFPIDEKIEVLYVQDDEPWIYVLLKTKNGPIFYKIDWTEENKKKMKDLQRMIGSSFAQGKFEKPKNHGEDSKSIFFTPMENMTDPEIKDTHSDDSVTFTTSGSSGNFSTGNTPGTTDRPSLQRPQDNEDTNTERLDYLILFNNNDNNVESGFIGPQEQTRVP